jgi:hypothetical protein
MRLDRLKQNNARAVGETFACLICNPLCEACLTYSTNTDQRNEATLWITKQSNHFV